MNNMFQAHYRSTIVQLIHDTGIQGYASIAVGQAAIAYTGLVALQSASGTIYAGFHGIQCAAA